MATLSLPPNPTLLDIVNACHNHSPFSDAAYTPFHLNSTSPQIGFLPCSVLEAILDDAQHKGVNTFGIAQEGAKTRVWINDEIEGHDRRTQEMQKVVTAWRDRGMFKDPLEGWRNELYAIYGPDPNALDSTGRRVRNVPAFSLERSACALFGLSTFGVHSTAYVRTPSSRVAYDCNKPWSTGVASEYAIWVPRRSKTKSTWPGFLDNSVAGGITSGDDPFESLIREGYEEAGLDADLLRNVVTQTGVISYVYRTPSGYVQPEIEYCYDIPLPSTTIPTPVDGEAESFQLLPIIEVISHLRKGAFKANSALVVIDFLMRHGIITFENADCNYLELSCRLHAELGLPTC